MTPATTQRRRSAWRSDRAASALGLQAARHGGRRVRATSRACDSPTLPSLVASVVASCSAILMRRHRQPARAPRWRAMLAAQPADQSTATSSPSRTDRVPVHQHRSRSSTSARSGATRESLQVALPTRRAPDAGLHRDRQIRDRGDHDLGAVVRAVRVTWCCRRMHANNSYHALGGSCRSTRPEARPGADWATTAAGHARAIVSQRLRATAGGRGAGGGSAASTRSWMARTPG